MYKFKYYQMLAGLGRQNPEKNFCLKRNQSSNISFPFFQVDLEPEGKVFVVITLTGSFTEGKGVTLPCSHSELDSGLCSAISSRAVQTFGFFRDHMLWCA